MFQKRIIKQNDEPLPIPDTCLPAYQNAFNEAVQNHNPLQTNPYITLKIVRSFPTKEETMQWNSGLIKLHTQFSIPLQEHITDYNMNIKKDSSGWTHTFGHLINVKAIDSMKKLLAGDSLESEPSQSILSMNK